MGLIEQDRVSDDEWREVIAGEPAPFGTAADVMQWREKSRYLVLRDDGENLVALAGLLLAEVEVGDQQLQVVGIGSVIVTRAARGRGLARLLVERLLEIAPELGAERAMLFCWPANVGLYAKFGFKLLEEPVFVQQPGGLVEMPMRTMWKPLTGAVAWPKGRVELRGEPF